MTLCLQLRRFCPWCAYSKLPPLPPSASIQHLALMTTRTMSNFFRTSTNSRQVDLSGCDHKQQPGCELTELACWNPGGCGPEELRLPLGKNPPLEVPSAKRLLKISGEGPPRLLPKGVFAVAVGWNPLGPFPSKPCSPAAIRGGSPANEDQSLLLWEQARRTG